MEINNILVPITATTRHKEVVEMTTTLAKKFDADVHVLHAHQVPSTVPTADGLAVTAPLEEIEQAESNLQAVTEAFKMRDVESVHSCLEQGDPANVILQYAEDHPIDLIVMKTQGRSGLDRLVLGSTTEEVLRNSDCPVLAIREEPS